MEKERFDGVMLNKSKIYRYLNLAKSAALLSDNKKTRVGCIIVYKKQVIGTGWNLENKTHPLQKAVNKYRGYDIEQNNAKHSQHAECHALTRISDLDIDWSKVVIFVYRLKRDGSRGLAKPCIGCETMLRTKGIKQVYYSTEIGWEYTYYENNEDKILWPI